MAATVTSVPLTRREAEKILAEQRHYLSPLVGFARLALNGSTDPSDTIMSSAVVSRINDSNAALHTVLGLNDSLPSFGLTRRQAVTIKNAATKPVAPLLAAARRWLTVTPPVTSMNTLDPQFVIDSCYAAFHNLENALGLLDHNNAMKMFMAAIRDGLVESGHDVYCEHQGCQQFSFFTATDAATHANTYHAL